MTTFNELPHDERPRGAGWRHLDPAVTVSAYVNNNWHDVQATEINDETREIRIELPSVRHEGGIDLIPHRILSPDLYRAAAGSLSRAAPEA